MIAFDAYNAPRIIYGEGVSKQVATLLQSLNVKTVMAVYDEGIKQVGIADSVLTPLREAGFVVEEFGGVTADPPVEMIEAAAKYADEKNVDIYIAIGGGGVIDTTKCMAVMHTNPGRLLDYVLGVGKPIPNLCPKVIAIPTTSGTGSEVTSFAILTHEGVKHPLIEENIRPQAAILDDSLLRGLPKGLIADAGMDVLAHCLEAIAAKNASAFTTAFASAAFRMVLEHLAASYQGDLSVRGEIHQAATMAGIAFDNAGLGVCHALSHALGGAFHLAHGRLNAILLPHVLRFNAQAVPAPYAALASFCGLAGPNGLVFAIRRLRRRLELPASLTAAGLERGDVLAKADSLCRAALQDPCAASNPRPVTLEDLHFLLQAAL